MRYSCCGGEVSISSVLRSFHCTVSDTQANFLWRPSPKPSALLSLSVRRSAVGVWEDIISSVESICRVPDLHCNLSISLTQQQSLTLTLNTSVGGGHVMYHRAVHCTLWPNKSIRHDKLQFSISSWPNYMCSFEKFWTVFTYSLVFFSFPRH